MTHLTRFMQKLPLNGVDPETWEPYTNLQPQSPPVVLAGVGVSPLGVLCPWPGVLPSRGVAWPGLETGKSRGFVVGFVVCLCWSAG